MKKYILLFVILLSTFVWSNDIKSIGSMYKPVTIVYENFVSINISHTKISKSIIPFSFTNKIKKINQVQLSYNLKNSLGYLKFIFKF